MLLYLVWSGLLGEEVVALQVPDCLHDRLQVLLSRACHRSFIKHYHTKV